MLSNILMGFSTAFNPMNLLLLMGGTVLGILFGALPGVSSTMGVAVLIPLTYGMDAASGLIMLAGIYCGSTYGGSISACLLNTPGTPASAATTMDGFPMTRKGRGGEALQEACIASFWGGIAGAIALFFLAPPICKFLIEIWISGKRNDGRIRTNDHRISFKRFSFKGIPFWIIRSSCFNGWNGCCDSISKIYL